MQYLFHTSNISTPTVDTFEAYAARRFSTLGRILGGKAARVNASLKKIGGRRKQFELSVTVLSGGHRFFARTTKQTITEAVDRVNKQLKKQIRRSN